MMHSWLRSRLRILIAHVVICAVFSEEFEVNWDLPGSYEDLEVAVGDVVTLKAGSDCYGDVLAKFNVIEFTDMSNYNDCETSDTSKFNELKSIRNDYNCESTILIEEPGETLIANKNYCTEGMKFNIIASGATSPTITPSIPIIYEIYNWKQGAIFKDINTIVNQKVRIDLTFFGHNIVEYPDEQSYNTCSNAEILVKEHNNLQAHDIDLDKVGTRYIGCSINKHDCNKRQKFKIVTWPENDNPEVTKINRKRKQKDSYVVSSGDKVVIIFDDSDNKKLFEYKTVNDYETCSNVEKGYKNSSFKFNAAKIGTRYFSTSRTCEKSARFQIKIDPPSIAPKTETKNNSDPPSIAPKTEAKNMSDPPAIALPIFNTKTSYSINLKMSRLTGIIGLFALGLFLFL